MLALSYAFADSPDVRSLGTVGSSRFWHEHPVEDARVRADGTLATVAGCSVRRWSADGALLGRVELGGCTPGLNDGLFSPDGQWVAASGLWTGEQGVWRMSGGDPVHRVESITWSRFCAGGLWDVDGAAGFRHLDLATGQVSHPAGDHGTGFLCVDDAWILDEHGHRVDADGTLTEIPGANGKPVGQTTDGRAIVVRYGGQLVLVGRDGAVSPGPHVPANPEHVLHHGDRFYSLADGVDDVVWAIDADQRIVGGPYFAEGQGLGSRAGLGALFVWDGAPWAWAGHRVFPLAGPAGPVDSTYERFFFDADEHYVCHGSTCEARRLDALDGAVRVLALPRRFSDESKLSPFADMLGQYDTRRLYRTELDTGAVQVQDVSAWPDGISVDAAGHFRWRLSEDEDEDEVWTTRVFHRQFQKDVLLGTWEQSWLADPGWTVLQLGPTMRWPNGVVAGSDEADGWFETPDGRVILAKEYGAGLEVYDRFGKLLVSGPVSADAMGAWGDGLWVASGRQVRFLGADLTVQGELTVPWDLADRAVDGAGSPDGAHFAARRPDGTLQVWRVGPPRLAASAPEIEALRRWAPEIVPGQQLGAPTIVPVPRPFLPSGDDLVPHGGLQHLEELLDAEPAQLLVMMAGFAPRTPQERLEVLAAVRALPTGGSSELSELRRRFFAVHEGGTVTDWETDVATVPDPAQLTRDLEGAVRAVKLSKHLAAYRAVWAAQPVYDGPLFGIEGCPARRPPIEHFTMAAPPWTARTTSPRTYRTAIVVELDVAGTPRWVGTLDGTSPEDARACWALHDDRWAPAVLPQPGCALVPCWEPPAE